jgi:hypothetical protein
MTQGIISPGLKSLMLINEGLRQLQESQVSPQSPEGLPTLAKQLAMAGQQAQAQPQIPPGLTQPILDDVAKKVNIGESVTAPIEGIPPQPQEQPPQAMAKGGIAGLRADNMRAFKEGGVLGFEEGKIVPKAKEESSSAIGRWWENLTQEADKTLETEKLRDQIRSEYGPKSSGAGFFMDQTPAEREKAKTIISKLDSLDLPALKTLASGETPKPSLIKEQPTENELLKYIKSNKNKEPNREPFSPEIIARQNQEALQTSRYQDPGRARLDTQAAYTPPVAPRPVAPRPAGPAAGPVGPQGLAGLAPGNFDIASIMKQLPPELSQSAKDYAEAIKNKTDFSGEQLSNLDLTRQEMLANRARQDKETPFLNLQKMFAQGAKSGYAGMGEANIAAKEAEQTLMEARATQDALAREKIVAIKSAAQAEKIGDKAGILAAQEKLATIGVNMATVQSHIEQAKITAAASIEHANIMARASAASAALHASIERDKMKMQDETNRLTRADASYAAMNNTIASYSAKKQAVYAEMDKTFELENKGLIQLAQTDADAKKQFEEAKYANEANKLKAGAAYDHYINNVENVMHQRFGVSHGVPAPMDQKAIASTPKTYKY